MIIIKKQLITLLMTFVSLALYAQELEVEGKVKIHVVENDSLERTLVVIQDDGTLATREADDFVEKEIGDFYQGGIIFFVYNHGQNGLIMSIKNLPIVDWGLNTDDISASESNFDGQANSDAIVEYHGTDDNYAALECLNYSHDGYDDWYLPSYGELRLIMEQFHKLNIILANDGVNATKTLSENNDYWSSTQYDNFETDHARVLDFQNLPNKI